MRGGWHMFWWGFGILSTGFFVSFWCAGFYGYLYGYCVGFIFVIGILI